MSNTPDSPQKRSFKQLFSWRNISNVLFFGVVILFLVNPKAKGWLMQGLMKVGFFQPDIEQTAKPLPVSANVSFRDAKGDTVSLASLQGKVVFINFWATWCSPCLAEMPSINSLNQKLSANKNIVVLMVDIDGEMARSQAFVKKHNYTLPVYQALNHIPDDLLGRSIPATIILNKAGQLVFKHDGIADYSGDKMYNYLTKLAAE